MAKKKRRAKKATAWKELKERLAKAYAEDMEAQVDKIFEYATYHLDWDWNQLADNAGLSRATVNRLGDRITQRPHHMTFFKLAHACGLLMAYIDSTTGDVIDDTILKAMQRDFKVRGGELEDQTIRLAEVG